MHELITNFFIGVGIVSTVGYLVCMIGDGPSTKYYIVDEEN